MSAPTKPRINSRRKGRRAATEARQMLEAAGWTCHERPAGMVGSDITAVDIDDIAYSVEVKSDGDSLASHWRQATVQAELEGNRPLLLWRISGFGWWLIVPTDHRAARTDYGHPTLTLPPSVSLPTAVGFLRRCGATPLPCIHVGGLVALPAVDALEVW